MFGRNTDTQTITFDNAEVSTQAGFSVNTATGNAVTITGDGALSYTDTNASPLTGATNALYMNATGDDGGTPGSIIIDTDGVLIGGESGIFASNSGSGAVTITADGDVTGTNESGIYARNSNYGTNLAVTSGTGTTVEGGEHLCPQQRLRHDDHHRQRQCHRRDR